MLGIGLIIGVFLEANLCLVLFIIGSNRIFVRFDIFQLEFEYFGKGGGR